MGSEQSSNKREYREPAATPRDVERALEQQRKIYEKKMEQLLEKNRQNTKSPTPIPSQFNSVCATASQQQQASAQPIRQHNLYPYNQNDLQSPGDFNKASLYPSLGSAAYSNPPQGNNNNMGKGNALYNPVKSYGGATYGDRAQNNQQIPQQAQRNSPLHPSAPPSEASSRSRSRSQSRQRTDGGDVNCVTCGKMYGERIYQCNQGHSSCDLCKTRQVQCGQCRQQLTNRRNIDLEKYVMERRVKCPNSMDGCRLFIKMADMGIHEKECPFRALLCPSLGSFCSWTGKMSQLADHFNEMHPLHNQGEVDKEMYLNITTTSHTMHFTRIGNFNFLFHIKIEADAMIYMAAQLIGTKHSAAKWDYEIHIYKKNEPRKKYQYTDRCSSASEPLQEIINSTKCAVIPQVYATTFICGGNVAYKFYIKREDTKPNESAASNIEESGDGRRGPPRRNYRKFVKNN